MHGALRMKIVVVTHEPERRARLAEFLGGCGYDVLVAPHRGNVPALVAEHAPHVVVLDLYVSEPGALATLADLRAAGYEGKVVALAGPSTREALAKVFRLGADQLVGEVHATGGPFDPLSVETAIRACFRQAITQRAEQLWEQEGRPAGRDLEFWVTAEREILERTG